MVLAPLGIVLRQGGRRGEQPQRRGSRVGPVCILAAAVTVAAWPAQADPPNRQVVVVNPVTAPVPVAVQGTMAVAGEVAITNAPTVTVGNEVAVRVTGVPAIVPYWVDRHLTLSDTATSIEGPLDEAPAGRRTVLEYVSFYCTTRPGDVMLGVGLVVEGITTDGTPNQMSFRFPLQQAAADHGGLTRWHASQSIRLYANPGEVRYIAVRTGGGDFWACDVAVSGHTVPMP